MAGSKVDFSYILGIMDSGLKFEHDRKLGQLVGDVDYDYICDLDKHHLTMWSIFTFARGQ